MTRYGMAVLFAAYTCFAWGMITPMAVRLTKELGDKYHPALPFLWNTFGNLVFSILLIVITWGAPLKVWSWHWSGWCIFFFWTSGSLVFALALYFAPERESVPMLIAAAYPALVSAGALWYFFGETMTLQKIIGFVVAFVGVALVVLSK
ncbi:MAG: EamA family transporter [bacterium]|nr:EamA family transporter [bacterium]